MSNTKAIELFYYHFKGPEAWVIPPELYLIWGHASVLYWRTR